MGILIKSPGRPRCLASIGRDAPKTHVEERAPGTKGEDLRTQRHKDRDQHQLRPHRQATIAPVAQQTCRPRPKRQIRQGNLQGGSENAPGRTICQPPPVISSLKSRGNKRVRLGESTLAGRRASDELVATQENCPWGRGAKERVRIQQFSAYRRI